MWPSAFKLLTKVSFWLHVRSLAFNCWHQKQIQTNEHFLLSHESVPNASLEPLLHHLHSSAPLCRVLFYELYRATGERGGGHGSLNDRGTTSCYVERWSQTDTAEGKGVLRGTPNTNNHIRRYCVDSDLALLNQWMNSVILFLWHR